MGRAKVTLKDWAPAVITEEIENKAMDGLERACEKIAAAAWRRFPLGAPAPMPGRKKKEPWMDMSTGLLRSSIRVRRLKGDPYLDVRVYAGYRQQGGGGPFYAHMIEFGTAKLSARPFLRPAFDAVKGKIISIISNEGGA